MEIVGLENIPSGEYSTPTRNLTHLFATGQRMEILCKASNGMGLSAAQVGIPWNFFVYWSNYPEEDRKFDYLFDCEYVSAGDKFLSVEGCLSLAGKYYEVERYEKVKVSGKKLVFDEKIAVEEFDGEFGGVEAVVLQHEIDHGRGRELMIDAIGRRVHFS
jgi:peptide deformylase